MKIPGNIFRQQIDEEAPRINPNLPLELQDEFGMYQAEYDELLSVDSERLQRYREYRKEHNLARSLNLWRDSGDYGAPRMKNEEPRRHNINLPFGMALTIKHAYRIAGRMPDVIVDRRSQDAYERHRSDTLEKALLGVIRESRGDQHFADSAWDGSKFGSGAFSMWFSISKQMPLFKSIDPGSLLVVRGTDDPHDFERVYHFQRVPMRSLRIKYAGVDFRDYTGGFSDQIELDEGADSFGTVIDVCTRTRKLRFLYEGCIPLDETIHNYGVVPYVVAPNLGPYRGIWGWGDYELYRALCSYIPQLFSQQADVLRAASGGAYQDKRSGQPLGEVEKVIRNGGVIPIRQEGSIEPIPAPDIPDFLVQHQDMAVLFLKMLSFAPDAAWGGGDAGSGADRNLQLGPLLEFTGMKQMNWGTALSRLFSYALMLIERKTVGTTTYYGSRTSPYGATNPFAMRTGPGLTTPPIPDEMGQDQEFSLSLPELIGGDYNTRLTFQNRIDVDDPAYVLSEINKFDKGLQSAYTTLERLGCIAPEDEMKLVEDEDERRPWLRSGMIQMILAELKANNQGEGGGPTGGDPSGGLLDALSMISNKDGAGGAMDADAGAAAANADGQLYGGA